MFIFLKATKRTTTQTILKNLMLQCIHTPYLFNYEESKIQIMITKLLEKVVTRMATAFQHVQ